MSEERFPCWECMLLNDTIKKVLGKNPFICVSFPFYNNTSFGGFDLSKDTSTSKSFECSSSRT